MMEEDIFVNGRPCASAEGENKFAADALSWLVGGSVSKTSFRCLYRNNLDVHSSACCRSFVAELE
jgi:hypothetical protein